MIATFFGAERMCRFKFELLWALGGAAVSALVAAWLFGYLPWETAAKSAKKTVSDHPRRFPPPWSLTSRIQIPDSLMSMTTLIIGHVLNDLTKKRVVVTLKWEDDPEKHLGLVVPKSDHTFQNLKAETEKAVRALAKELESAAIRSETPK
jgi:hypothetical protein